MGAEPTTFELEVQRANPLRHEGFAKLPRLSKPITLKLFLLFQKTIYKSSLRFISDFFNVDKNYTVFQNTQEKILLYEYRDLFIDMDVGNNRSELAITNRH